MSRTTTDSAMGMEPQRGGMRHENSTVEAIGRLEELARAATPGPYVPLSCPDIPTDCCDYGVVSEPLSRETCRVWLEADARFIAAANPQAILSLIAELRHSVEREAGLREALDEYHGALTRREHGGVAASRLVEAVEEQFGQTFDQYRARLSPTTREGADR